MKSEINKELIFDHFARKTSPLQRQLIEQWLRTRANEEQYYVWLEEWENNGPQYVAQTEAALQQYSRFLASNPHTDEPAPAPVDTSRPARERRYGWTWLMAASVVLLLGLGGWLFRDLLRYQTYRTDYGEISTVRLADGSRVTLNANTTLQVPRWGFGNQSREVWLRGEASFAVKHLPDHRRFVVRTDQRLDVVVLGTEFSVYTRERGAKVVLRKGKVQVNYADRNQPKQLLMKPGDQVTLDRRNRLTHRALDQPQLYPGWEDKRFVFDETTLQEVAYMLRESYGLEVEIRDKALASRVLMGSFRADNVDQLLQTISELLDINVVRQGNHVRLSTR
ncbi:FecR family protein [Spirosoma sp. 209]|uniref:FecR family protein n=1 Tax=Spirosoma sp. 209 TaxID=1955701 RepID=UPI00098D2978|nr:FecR domain-containing protein [Spirosoma sp. 209]